MQATSTPTHRSGLGLGVRIVVAVVAWLVVYSQLEALASALTFDLMGLERGSRLGDAIAFILYDVPKITLLLTGIVIIVSVIRSYFSPERVRRALAARGEQVGTVMAALLGVVTPFCSCSAVPLFIGFVESGVPLRVTFSFLIAAPVVNEVALVLLAGLFGWQIALIHGYAPTEFVVAYAGRDNLLAVPLAVPDAVMSTGRVPSRGEITGWLQEAAATASFG